MKVGYSMPARSKSKQLKVKLVLAMSISVLLFSAIIFFIERESKKSIQNIGNIYMHNISEELILHFTTIINSQFYIIANLVTEKNIMNSDKEALKAWLVEGLSTSKLAFLALYSSDGKYDVIYGNDVKIDEEKSFIEALRKGNRKITSGESVSGEKLMLMGVPSIDITKVDDSSIAIIAGISIDYIKNTLELDAHDSTVFSHIIRPDGSFVIRSGDAVLDNYFERVHQRVLEGAAEIVSEMKKAMRKQQHYSAVLEINHGIRRMHCKSLPYSDWFLVMIMPYGSADGEISRLTTKSMYMTLAGGCIVVFMLLWIFRSYSKELKEQVIELDMERKNAIEANRFKSMFLSNMSHDIRTPMNAILGMTSIAMSNMDNREQVQNCLQKIIISSRHLLSLINDVLDIAKIESGKLKLAMETLSLRDLVESVVTIIQPQVYAKHQNFDVLIHDIYAEELICDGLRLSQVLINLLGNAVKFTPEGGSIRLCIYEELSFREDRILVHLLVEDTGMGMTPEFKEKIFESFCRADNSQVHRTEGSGLGMTITKHIVDAMAGTIDVQSEVGKGSCFHIILDLEKAPVREGDMRLPGRKTLVVDANMQTCGNTVVTLKALGMDAVGVADAESALQRLDERRGTSEAYRVVLVDWALSGAGGIELVKEIRRQYGEGMIILISACDWTEIEKEGRAAGVTGFITKPLFKSTLFNRLKPLLSGKEEADRPTDAGGGNGPETLDDFTGKRVLLAEDNEMNWEIANELLSLTGLKLDWAENGQICLEMFRKSPVGYYDAILMDVRMPVMSGLEAAREIRALDRADAPAIPIIAMTADTFTEDIRRCLDSGMNAHVAKPIDVRVVSRLLKKHIEKKAPTA